uniref:DUF6598 domain-containing protein n=1 Tax=Oryza rufipogon TaxID=4529 RepID=A0A0E0Q8D1_ORYRU
MQTRSATRRKEAAASPAMGTRATGKSKTTEAVGARAARGNKQAGAATKREEATATAIAGTGSGQSPSPEVEMDAEAEAEPSTRKRPQASGPEEGKVEGEEGDSALAKRVRDDAEDDEEDEEAAQAFNFRHFWNFLFSAQANFEDITDVPPMRHTDDPGAIHAKCRDAVQVYSVEVKQIKCGLQWPIEVFGHVAVRDSIDRKRNLVFNRGRDDCQTLTAQDSSLVLTGPSRYVLAMDNPDFEVELKVKGITETEDKVLSSLAFTFNCMCDNGRVKRHMASNKRSTVQIKFALIPETVEATFEVEVIDGSWDPSLRPHFFASTHHLPSMKFVLLDPREGAMVINDNNNVRLTRSVVSVQVLGGLKLTAEALDDENTVVHRTTVIFKPQRAGRINGFLDLNRCKMMVKVAWSRLSIC